MTWITTDTGACNSAFVIKIERTDDGTVLFLTDGTKARTSSTFDVIDGKLVVVEPIDDGDDDSTPF